MSAFLARSHDRASRSVANYSAPFFKGPRDYQSSSEVHKF